MCLCVLGTVMRTNLRNGCVRLYVVWVGCAHTHTTMYCVIRQTHMHQLAQCTASALEGVFLNAV